MSKKVAPEPKVVPNEITNKLHDLLNKVYARGFNDALFAERKKLSVDTNKNRIMELGEYKSLLEKLKKVL